MAQSKEEEARNPIEEGIMTKDEIKKAILDALGNPSSGAIVQHIDLIADAVVGLNAPNSAKASDNKPAKETRVIEASEKR